MNYIVVGASAGLGRALADKLAESGNNLLIVASNEEDLQAQSADLRIRHSVRIEHKAMRVRCDENSVKSIVEAAAKLGEVDGIFFPMGYSRNDDDGTLKSEDITRIIDSNLAGIVAITAAFLPRMLEKGEGLLVFFGSVAAERGRSSNIAYAAAKRGLQSFYESIRHRSSSTNIRVQYYQLGYLKTAQTFGKKLPFPAAEPEQAAAYIISGIAKNFGQKYFPWFWQYICLALRMTPWFVFKKLKF
ncbi:MAG: SDR family oxidoreductase [Candidatus Obscuribacterales bacterium]|nr:SDR family oxidoreductase [Candidatus Obscuribacterales bacterium]